MKKVETSEVSTFLKFFHLFKLLYDLINEVCDKRNNW